MTGPVHCYICAQPIQPDAIVSHQECQDLSLLDALADLLADNPLPHEHPPGLGPLRRQREHD